MNGNHRKHFQHNDELKNNKLENQPIENSANNVYPLVSIENNLNQIYSKENPNENATSNVNGILNHHHHHQHQNLAIHHQHLHLQQQQQILTENLEMNCNTNNENDGNFVYQTSPSNNNPMQINANNLTNTPAHQIQKPNFNINEFRNPNQIHLIQNQNNHMVQQYSTPATNQPPPSHQLLQATLIPTISEDKPFFRQRNGAMPPPIQPPLPPSVQAQPQHLQTPLNQNQIPVHKPPPPPPLSSQNYLNNNDNDQTIQTITNENELDGEIIENHHHHHHQYAQYLPQQPPPQPHKKLNTMEIFAFNIPQQPQVLGGGEIPSTTSSSSTTTSSSSSSSSSATNLIATHQLPPQPQHLIPHHHDHHHLANDPDLSLNDTDNEDDNSPREHLQNTNGLVMSNQLIKMDFVGGVNANNKNNQHMNEENKETSMVDLNELDEAQLKQLQQEEEKQQQEYFNIDHLNRYIYLRHNAHFHKNIYV
jgi:hypothetical protein